jgi:translation initiation factor IF-3
LALVNGRLATALVSASGEKNALTARLTALAERRRGTECDFVLKQDHMRRMLSDGDFVKQAIRRRERYIGEMETIFKFED